MNNDIRNEMIVLLNADKVCGDCQIKILAVCAKFLSNDSYMDKIKPILDGFFPDNEDVNLWIELPKITAIIVETNKQVVNNEPVDIDTMKFVVYAVIYHYLDNYQSIFLNKQPAGFLRVCWTNLVEILTMKPKHVNLKKLTLWKMFIGCICGDDSMIRL